MCNVCLPPRMPLPPLDAHVQIELNGAQPLKLQQGDKYHEFGVFVEDENEQVRASSKECICAQVHVLAPVTPS
jgi:hypothetical protein